MLPSTGSATWDLVCQVGIALAMATQLVLIARAYRNRR